MSMHILPVYYTTTSTKKRKKKNKTASLIAAEKEHAKFLERISKSRSRSSVGSEHSPSKRDVARSSRAEIAKQMGDGVGTQGGLINLSAADYRSREGSIPSSPTISYHPSMAKKQPKVYSGKRKLLGIATLHKSNMVPVFSKDDAEEISKMRRG